MNTKLTTVLLSVLIIISVATAYADDNEYAFVGTTILDVQKVSIGARQAGMGEAFVGLANDINCGSFNPAGFALLDYKTITASHNEWIGETNYDFFAFGMPYGKGTFIAGLNYFDEGKIKEADFDAITGQPIYTGRDLGAHNFQFNLGYATKVKPWFLPKMYMGMNARFLQYVLADEHRGAFLVDMGFLIPFAQKFGFGISVLNVGTGTTEMPEDDELPPVLGKLGLGADRIIDTEAFDLTLAADLIIPKPMSGSDKGKSMDPRFNIGGEIWLKDLLALRAGYKVNSSEYSLEDLTMGVGFKVNDYQLDYAYVDYGDLDVTHRLTATMSFGELARPDRDGDGIPDDDDYCPDEPEDDDDYEDQDGCPDLDNDRDGIFDVDDKCPNQPEYFNGFDDEDGCPDCAPPVGGMEEDATKTFAPQDTDLREGPCIGPDCEDERGFYYLLAGYDYVRPILFDTDQYTIKPESRPALEKIAKILQECICNGDMIEIRGHADERGGTDYNKELSERRANAVREYMITNFGLPAEKMVAVGAGEDEPLMPKEKEEYYQFNRRVVFRVIAGEHEE